MRMLVLPLAFCCAILQAANPPPPDFVAAVPAGARLTAAAPPSDALVAAITRADDDLFKAVFDDCDGARVRALVTDDFEFHHDSGGRIAGSGTQFAERIAKQCAARDAHSTTSRRELVPGTLAVFPDGADRAMETGVHRFYEHAPGKPEHLVGIARFAHVWHREGGIWRVERVLSLDHHAVEVSP